jgi:anhydro-N-acetylmuramic acid kinase
MKTPEPSPKVYRVIGLMSGTSLDGVDAAIIETDGERVLGFGASISVPYSVEHREILESATRKALKWNFMGPRPNEFARAEDVIHESHAGAVQSLLEAADLSVSDINFIGLHGQTVLHRPPTVNEIGHTLQLGDGERLARELGTDVFYDFRSADVATGGQGAPLAPIYHKALMEMAGYGVGTVVLNIGGVSNFTVLNAAGELIASDAGPGNGPLDQWVKQNGLGDYDAGGALSLKGTPDFARLEGWLSRDFFKLPLPKSADRYDFDVLPRMHGLSPEDGAATLCAFTAMGVAHSLAPLNMTIDRIIVCGGGRYNPAIMGALRETMGAQIVNAENAGWDGDALEAQAFAYLAARTKLGLPISFPKTTGVKQPLTGGKYASAS